MVADVRRGKEDRTGPKPENNRPEIQFRSFGIFWSFSVSQEMRNSTNYTGIPSYLYKVLNKPLS